MVVEVVYLCLVRNDVSCVTTEMFDIFLVYKRNCVPKEFRLRTPVLPVVVLSFDDEIPSHMAKV